jgi:hypothetical protein
MFDAARKEPWTMSLAIRPNQKYALIAMRTIVPHLTPNEFGVADGLWASCSVPFKIDDPWKEWIGSIRLRALENSNLVLVATAPATPSSVGVLDGENQHLSKKISWLYQALLLTGGITVFDQPMLLTGAYEGDRLTVRQLQQLVPPSNAHGFIGDQFTWPMLTAASELRDALDRLDAQRKAGAPFDRLFRVLGIHLNALTNRHPLERIHQFCRTLEGLILPDIGKTTKQFRARTELFVGPKSAQYMERLYEMRSQIEHVHAPQFPDWPSSERERRLLVARTSIVAEEIARTCLERILRSAALHAHFATDQSIAAFWTKPADELRTLWGAPLDIKDIERKRFEPRQVSDADLGL